MSAITASYNGKSKKAKFLPPLSQTRKRGCGLAWSRIEAFQARKRIKRDVNGVLEAFRDFCLVDLRLKESTVGLHLKNIERVLGIINKNPLDTTVDEVRAYLRMYLNRANSTYANQIKTLRVFFRDFLGRGELVQSFKFPVQEFTPRMLPSTAELKIFYSSLKTDRDRLLFLLYATTGLRKHEVISLELNDIDITRRMVMPNKGSSRTKRTWYSFFNEETKEVLKRYLESRRDTSPRLFPIENSDCFRHGSKITPQVLRFWFANKMAELGVQDRYIDAFCGRTPKSVLARHYTDYSPDRLKGIYDKANFKVLD